MDAAELPPFPAILRSYPCRLAIYGAITVVVYQLVYVAVVQYGAATVGRENGPLEAAQAMLAVLASICMFYAASRLSSGKASLIVAACLVGYAAARESDKIFETLFFDDAYKWLVGLPLFVLATVAVIAQRRTLISEGMWLMRQPAATLFVVAGIYLCGVCQVLDRPDFWTSISAPAEAEAAKALMEEFAELFAYMLLAFSGVEAIVTARRKTMEVAGDRGVPADTSSPTVRIAA